ncbi:hypothetical protein GQ44DRAFT_672358 [Phaeosphaeriaceae sp. PMI808]|nr:hypothetical protein GQ44DRAFT_672358 [Phaeosphaeriaceae sp. PMI808]
MEIPDLPLGLQFLTSLRVPPELVLQTIQHLPFENGKRIASLYANPRVKTLIQTYEHSITRCFMEKELRHALADFPFGGEINLRWLSHCVARYDVVDAIMDELTWPDNCVAVQPQNVSLVNAGLLLLYQLAPMHHKAKLEFIKSLPRDPLVSMYISLDHGMLTGRYHGHGWIHQRTYGRAMDGTQLSLREEMEFCFAEAALSVGPEFLYDMLINPSDPCGEITLLNVYHEHGTHDWSWPSGGPVPEFEPPRTQGPHLEESNKGGSLFTAMLERMAELEGCPVGEVKSRVEGCTDERNHNLAFLSLGAKAKLVRGLDIN